ncbi:sugar ABC transporter ATP-binding protein [Spirochaeta africana]|uniref:ABC-type sugar transport system, ATPase component n=1 Tax=Spirochaeta africana (strain ATCC 700263 / DSM 8902 / Z-7692) TaxID=889378 RepID=H9UG74_SPIAZ|nr:sugar ABC transporter ATP-binding protein [Spirochaeta africana]AFG36517.1 ABC-type sugar transport system, ATPase component [Spirochaeta africana DSM 8902]
MTETHMEKQGSDYLLEVQGISKSFPGVKALDSIHFRLRPGTVHVLCGENGAGKSTFLKIMNGLHQPDQGEIRVHGEAVQIRHPLQARRLGIGMIFQELDYVPNFTVEQSLFLGEEPRNAIGGVNWKQIRRRTVELLQAEGLPYKPTTRLKDLTVSDIQMLEILKAVSSDTRILLMDEPTSAITDKEIDMLFAKIRQLRDKGVGIVYISHKLDEIFRIADEITVFRDGQHVGNAPAAELDKDRVIAMMVGRRLENIFPDKPSIEPGGVALELRNLSRGRVFQDVSLQLRAGEVVGMAGLVGAGRTEIARAIFGLDPYDSGEVLVHDVAPQRRNDVAAAISSGVAMLSEDRKRYGLVLSRSVKENASLLVLRKYFARWWNNARAENRDVRAVFKTLNVKTSSLSTIAGTLSGGNQQKVVLTKWLLKDQDVVILDEPTRGIDVGAKYEIYKIILELAAKGKAVLVISSELPELIGICDRLYVVAKGRITKELKRDEFSQETIMKYAAQGEADE